MKFVVKDFQEAATAFEETRIQAKKLESHQLTNDLSDVALMTLAYSARAQAQDAVLRVYMATENSPKATTSKFAM